MRLNGSFSRPEIPGHLFLNPHNWSDIVWAPLSYIHVFNHLNLNTVAPQSCIPKFCV